MGLAGVVLAAGASERMGRPKALLDFRGRPFAVRILEALEALDLKSRVVVLGLDAARVRPSLATHECVIVENADGAGAVLAAHARDLVTVAVNDPAVIDDLNTPEDYERLIREVNRDIY